jgi:hypothetical protein
MMLQIAAATLVESEEEHQSAITKSARLQMLADRTKPQVLIRACRLLLEIACDKLYSSCLSRIIYSSTWWVHNIDFLLESSISNNKQLSKSIS